MATVATSIHSFTSTFRSLYSPPTAIFPTSIFQLRLQPSSPILRSIVSIKCRVDGANTSHFTALGKNVRSFGIVSALGKISETEMVPVPEETEGNLPDGSGIYGIYDSSGELQFIGITRNIAASVASHRKKVPDLCFSVKVGLMDEPTPDRTVLTDAWKSWMQEHLETTGKVPPGNESGNNTWMRPQKKPDLRLTRGRHVKLSLPLEDLIDQLVKEKKIVTFIKGSRSSPQCGFSQRVVGILESQGVDFECVNILDEEHNFGLRETLKTYSNWPTFPQIFLNGELLGGCDILCAMEEKGELGSLLEK